jgi:hypothetical protein
MIKLIYKIFKKQLNKLVFETDQLHYDWRDKCEMAYIDVDGLKYYRFKDSLDIPVQRAEYLQGLLILFEQGFNTKEYKLFIDGFEHEINETVNNEKYRGKGLAKIMQLVRELRSRSEIRLEPDLMLEMMAVILIEENENPNIIDHKVIDVKVKKFKADNKERSASFFIQGGLVSFIPFLPLIEKDWMKYMATTMQELKMSQEVLGTLMTGYKSKLELVMNNE